MPPRTRRAPSPPEAAELVAAGAMPTTVDSAAMLRQIDELQKRVARVESEKGVPSDPVAAALQNLRDHLKAHKTMHRRKEDLAELVKALDTVDDDLDSDDSAFVLDVANEVPSTVEGHDYLRQLARDLHAAVRDREDETEEEPEDTAGDETGED